MHDDSSMHANASPAQASTAPAALRRVRSYVLRAGRMGTGQQRALRELAPAYVVPFSEEAPHWPSLFSRNAPLLLEIGFGMGDATASIAAASPRLNLLGVEVHPPGRDVLGEVIQAGRAGDQEDGGSMGQ